MEISQDYTILLHFESLWVTYPIKNYYKRKEYLHCNKKIFKPLKLGTRPIKFKGRGLIISFLSIYLF